MSDADPILDMWRGRQVMIAPAGYDYDQDLCIPGLQSCCQRHLSGLHGSDRDEKVAMICATVYTVRHAYHFPEWTRKHDVHPDECVKLHLAKVSGPGPEIRCAHGYEVFLLPEYEPHKIH